jgi:hypothetical protein
MLKRKMEKQDVGEEKPKETSEKPAVVEVERPSMEVVEVKQENLGDSAAPPSVPKKKLKKKKKKKKTTSTTTTTSEETTMTPQKRRRESFASRRRRRKALQDEERTEPEEIGEGQKAFVPSWVMGKEHASSSALEQAWELLHDVFPDASSDFSVLFHESGKGLQISLLVLLGFGFFKQIKGELCLKIAKEFPDATIVSYSSTDEDAQAHYLSAQNLGVANNMIGNPLHFAQSSSHDPIERAVRDLRASLDLFDVQIVTPHMFGLLLHHPQQEFEKVRQEVVVRFVFSFLFFFKKRCLVGALLWLALQLFGLHFAVL